MSLASCRGNGLTKAGQRPPAAHMASSQPERPAGDGRGCSCRDGPCFLPPSAARGVEPTDLAAARPVTDHRLGRHSAWRAGRSWKDLYVQPIRCPPGGARAVRRTLCRGSPSCERPSLAAARYPFWSFVRHLRAVRRYWPPPGRDTLDLGVMRMLAFDGATKRFGPVTALDGCTFAARPGRLTGFLGPNGAGKTTAMRAVFGLVELDAGTVRWQGRPVSAAERARFGSRAEDAQSVAGPVMIILPLGSSPRSR